MFPHLHQNTLVWWHWLSSWFLHSFLHFQMSCNPKSGLQGKDCHSFQKMKNWLLSKSKSIGLTPLICISVEPAVTQNCVPLLQTKVMYSYITILSVFLIMGTFGEKYVHSFLANPCISEKPNVYKFDSLYQPLTLYYPQLYSTNGFLFRLYQTFK